MARKSKKARRAAGRPIDGRVGVALQRSASTPTRDQAFWAAIRSHANAISFSGYQGFIESVLSGDAAAISKRSTTPRTPSPDLSALSRAAKQMSTDSTAAHELLKTATEVFLLWNCGVVVRQADALGRRLANDDEELARTGLTVGELSSRLAQYLGAGRLPYIERVVQSAFPDHAVGNSMFATGVLTPRIDGDYLVELIWSYWHEEGMLARSMNAVSQRFQNIHGPGDRDPLAHLAIDPLRPLNNLLWGYVQDEPNRLSVQRRGFEYDHEYGLRITGTAVPAPRPADSRSRFLDGFHDLLNLCAVFYGEDSNTAVIADGFPLAYALRNVHILLAQGAHNQFRDLPWTARVEMLVQQWLLARPEMREFLRGPTMVPYVEAWMPQVDAMKTMQGWPGASVIHFHDLATLGEQILLGVRYGDWIEIDENRARNWARYWRAEIQGYIHTSRIVTGINLVDSCGVDCRPASSPST